MNQTFRTLVAGLVLVALLPFSAIAAAPTARIEGLVIGADGQRSPGATVYLFDRDGATQGEAVADDDGIYSIRDLAAGQYGMGVKTATGIVAPVASPPVRLADGELARRDLKLVEADDTTVDAAVTANYGFGSWFKGLSGGEKAGLIVGFVALAYLIYDSLDSEDDETPTASPSEPISTF